jgi:4-oxalocrotonate tautomerase
MPLVRIDLRSGKSPAYRRTLADAVHQAMVDTINIPEDDRFQVINEHSAQGLIYSERYLGIDRSDDVIFIQITLNVGRVLEQKKALYARIVELLADKLGVRREDVLITLLEVNREDWSFGNGLAQYATT